MPTLTQARRRVTTAIALLRALDVRVSTVVGHDAMAGEYTYSLRLPDGIPAAAVADGITTRHGYATTPYYSDGHHVIVHVSRPPAFLAKQNDIDSRVQRASEVATILDYVRGRLSSYDTKSSASRQHFIDTGRYLRYGEAQEA